MEVLSSEPTVKVSEVLEKKITKLVEGKVGHPARSLDHRYFHVLSFKLRRITEKRSWLKSWLTG